MLLPPLAYKFVVFVNFRSLLARSSSRLLVLEFMFLGLRMDSVVRNASPNLYSLIDFNILSYGEVLSFITPELKIILRKLEKLLKKKESLIIGAKFIITRGR